MVEQLKRAELWILYSATAYLGLQSAAYPAALVVLCFEGMAPPVLSRWHWPAFIYAIGICLRLVLPLCAAALILIKRLGSRRDFIVIALFAALLATMCAPMQRLAGGAAWRLSIGYAVLSVYALARFTLLPSKARSPIQP